MRSITVGLIIMLFVSAAVQAGMYKWVDEHDRTHFSDRPPVDVDSETVNTHTGGASTVAPPSSSRQEQRDRLLELYAKEREEKKAAKAKAEAEKEERKRRCERARKVLRRYEGRRIYDTLPDGSRRYLGKEEHAAEVQRARDEVSRWCR